MKDLSENSYIRKYIKRQHLYHQGDHAKWLFIVQYGLVRIYRDNTDGGETVAGVFAQGDVFGERVIMPVNRKHMFSAQAIKDSSVVEISGAVIRKIAESNPQFTKFFADILLNKLSWLHVFNEQLTHMSTSQRVACLLLRSSTHTQSKGTVILPFDKATASAQLGMKRETFSRSLSQLKRVGVDVSGPKIRVEDFAHLSEYCCQQCPLNKHECSGRRCESSAGSITRRKMKYSDVSGQLSMEFEDN